MGLSCGTTVHPPLCCYLYFASFFMLDLSLLDSDFHDKIKQLVAILSKNGHLVVPTSGFRSMDEQAKLWRRGRPTYEIMSKIANYRLNKCDFLADTLEKVGAQQGSKCTNAPPGFSWHNWGQALDVIIDDKKDGSDPVYEMLEREAMKLGMKTGLRFTWGSDPGHIQLKDFEPSKFYTTKQINDHFAAKAKK